MCDVLEDTLRRVDIDRPRFTYTELRRHDDAAWAQVVSLGLVHRVEDTEWAECDWCGEAEENPDRLLAWLTRVTEQGGAGGSTE